MNGKMKAVVFTAIIFVAVFTAVIPGVTSGTSEEIEELQQWVYDLGYNYTVAKNWITRLSPDERKALCGYKSLMPPTELKSLPENVGFHSTVEILESERVGQPPVGQPPTYDAMALGYVTPVKDQAGCGSCWIFGATANFESKVAIGETSLLDFSEQEVGDCNIWGRFCNGGNAYMTTNYFSKKGAANELCHPYVAAPQTCYNCPSLKNADNWRIITGSNGESQIDTIKNAILNYGPVYATIYASDAGFSAYDSGVYEYWGTESTDHAVEIIGWNDSKEHSHGTGAWMVKNSWGTDWGASGPYPGCAWIAYGVANLGDYTSTISGYNNDTTQVYYHDEYGWMGYCVGYGTNTAWGAVWFTPTQYGQLESVDFWADDVNMQYEIKVFDTISGGPSYTFSNQLGTTQTGSTTEMGYYSIPLNTPIPLVSGDDFIVQVKLTTSGWNYPIPIDYAQPGDWFYSDWHAVSSGESYTSSDGNTFSAYSYDIGIRARMGVMEPRIEVNKTVWDAVNKTWVKEITANISDILTFKCEIHNSGTCCNLTNITVTDNLSDSLEYKDNATVNGEPWEPMQIGNKYQWEFPEWLFEPCETITIEFDAHVVKCGYGWNEQFADAWCEETEEWVYDEERANITVLCVAPKPFINYGYVFCGNGSECINPSVNITNLNTSKQWEADTNASYNYYQLILDTTSINTGNVLEFYATDKERTQCNILYHTVTQSDVDAGGLFNFNITLNPFNINITSPENRTYASACIRLNFTVEPEGVTLDWIGYNLDGGANVTIAGNTTVGGLSACGHNIVVYARDNNGNTAASNLTYFMLHPGDINGDGVVNVFDLQRLAWAFNSYPTHPEWNENADLNCDNKVNVFDLQLLAWNFGNDYNVICGGV